MKDYSFYHGKKVFLTGHTGFKGSWMLAWLHQLGAEVKGYALAPDLSDSLYNSIQGDKLCSSTIADIRNVKRLENEMATFQPDYVFHLAAQALVRLSYEIPAETFEVNAMGTANVLNAVRKLDKPCAVILITTDKVYKNNEQEYAYRETDPLGGYDPYSASKACAELIIDSYRNSFFNNSEYKRHRKAIASARAGNVIGGGDWATDRIVPDIVKALQKGEEVLVRNPVSVRPWQHVLEPVSGYLHLGIMMNESPGRYAEAWNFGPLEGENVTVEELTKKAISCWGKGSYRKPLMGGQPHEAGLLKLDIRKAVTELSWKPGWAADAAVDRTIQWYKQYFDGVPPIELMTNDIKAYCH